MLCFSPGRFLAWSKNPVAGPPERGKGAGSAFWALFWSYAFEPPNLPFPFFKRLKSKVSFSHDLYREGLYTVAGYAPVKGMCTGSRSCTINEGLDFGSVFVVTHEMGHSLGMYHDGDNECDLRCCIMSPSVGSGKTHWSRCSVKEMRQFLGVGPSFQRLVKVCFREWDQMEGRRTA